MAMFKKVSASAALMAAVALPTAAVVTATSASAAPASTSQHTVVQSDMHRMNDVWPI